MSKIIDQWKIHSWRIIFVALNRCNIIFTIIIYEWRRLKIFLFCRSQIGQQTKIGSNCSFTPGSFFKIGDRVHIGRNSTFVIENIENNNMMSVGDETWISEGFLMHSTQGVKIGKSVLIGEYVSIRDATHNREKLDIPIRDQGNINGRIVIEDDVWIGRGCLIQGKPETVVIGTGAIIGANSVVSRSVPAGEIWGGVPARLIKKR